MKGIWYVYEGPVITNFGRLLTNYWAGITKANSLAQGRNNLMYQFKKQNNLPVDYKIEFVKEVETYYG